MFVVFMLLASTTAQADGEAVVPFQSNTDWTLRPADVQRTNGNEQICWQATTVPTQTVYFLCRLSQAEVTALLPAGVVLMPPCGTAPNFWLHEQKCGHVEDAKQLNSCILIENTGFFARYDGTQVTATLFKGHILNTMTGATSAKVVTDNKPNGFLLAVVGQ